MFCVWKCSVFCLGAIESVHILGKRGAEKCVCSKSFTAFFLCASLWRLLCTWQTMARRVQSAVTAARPTCVPTCSSLMEGAASSVPSATVSMKVHHHAHIKTSASSRFSTVLIQFVFLLSLPSASLLLPTSGPHGPEGGLLREA